MKQTFFRACVAAAALACCARSMPLAAQEHTLVFFARPPALRPFSIGGHAFVSWMTEDTLRQFSEVVYGFYPAKPRNLLTMWFKTRGKVVEGFEQNYAHHLWVEDCVKIVGDSIFHHSMASAARWHGTKYHLLSRNCLAFMDAVADEAGLLTPSTRRFVIFPKSPTRYLRELMRLNL